MTTVIQAPVERIVAILEASKAFRRVSSPIRIGNVPFEFSAVLLGQDKNPDLVVVIDTINEDSRRTRQKIGGLGRAMDVVGSRRPVTAILTGPRPDENALEAIARVCRVLPVGTPTGTNDAEMLEDWLSVLLPLSLPSETGIAADPIGEMNRLLPDKLDHALASSVVQAAPRGARAVQQELRRHLLRPLELADKMLGGDEAGVVE
jgi:hypothetical protein